MSRIQPFGVLVAVQASTDIIQYCSANVGQFLGVEPVQILGQTVEQWIPDYWHQLAHLASGTSTRFLAGKPFPIPLGVVSHSNGDYRYFEFETVETESVDWWNYTDRIDFLQEMAAAKTPEECCELALRWVFKHSGYDRVMQYEFQPDLHGKVVQEMCVSGDERFLGLHFPEMDIPPNAHELYMENRQRMIADVSGVDVPVLSYDPAAGPLDMTYCMLRSVHPAHITYLQNMGVHATFSISIVINNKLHSLITCHNNTPRRISFQERVALEEIGRMISVHLDILLQLKERAKRANLRQKIARLEGALSNAGFDIKAGISRHFELIRDLLSAESVWLHFDGKDLGYGTLPSAEDLQHLKTWLRKLPLDTVSTFHVLPDELRGHNTLGSLACGLMFLPLNDDNYLAALRPEQAHTVTWAGKPWGLESEETLPMSPRNSFEEWVQAVRYTAQEWGAAEIEFAAELRGDLLNYIAVSRLEHVALHDPLTGVANRTHFDNTLKIAVAEAVRSGKSCALHMLDLDNFKAVNDSMGHAAGDAVLKQVAERLTKLVRHQDTVARMGGDEFAVIQSGLADKCGATILAEKIISYISQPYLLQGMTAKIGISAGTAMCPGDSTDASCLTKFADFALYQAKRSGKNQVVVYLPGMEM